MVSLPRDHPMSLRRDRPTLCQSTHEVDGTTYQCERKFYHSGKHFAGTQMPGVHVTWRDD